MAGGDTGSQSTNRWLMLAVCVALGLALGFLGRRAMGSGDSGATVAAKTGQKAKSGREAEAVPPPPTAQSKDSVADIVADRTATRLGRIELWLLDADLADMERLWEGLKDAEGVTYRDMDALFIRWTAIDPGGAIAAAEGTKWAHIPWWGWARSEPEKTFRTALRERPQRLSMVMRSIGQSNPELAQRLAKEHPEALNSFSVEGVAYGLSQIDSQRAVEFGRSHGISASDQMETWANREPEGMLSWLARNEITLGLSSGASQGVKMAAREHPERIAEFIEMLPAGAVRQAMMREGINVLAVQDPEAALALVERTRGTGAETEWYGVLGTALAYEDVERSMELFAERAALGAAGPEDPQFADESRSGRGGANDYRAWALRLAETYPEEVIPLARELGGILEHHVVTSWMGRDPDGLGNWLQSEPAGDRRDGHIEQFATHLADSEIGDYVTALQWMSSITDEERRANGTRNVVLRMMDAERIPHGEALLNGPGLPAGVREAYERELEVRKIREGRAR